MWQLFELGAIVTSATQDVVDKFALVRNRSIDSIVATFHRTLLFLCATAFIGLLVPLGGLRWFFSWEIVLFAPLTVAVALLWTYVLRNVEVLTIGAAAYVLPLLYLFIDSHVLHTQFSLKEISGIAFLVLGGVAFSIDDRTLRWKTELTPAAITALVLVFSYNGAEAYFFKHLNTVHQVNGATFYVSLWLISSLALLGAIVIQGKLRLLIDRSSREYVPKVAVSKFCDALSALLSAQALTLAAVSQVTAFDALYPLISFTLVLLVQGVLRMRLDEKLQRPQIAWKTGAILLLAAGGLLTA